MTPTENPLERAFMARIKSEEYAAELKTLQDEVDEQIAVLQEEFNAREDVIDLKRRIERCEQERKTCIEAAKASGISKMGSFLLKERTRTVRTVIPWRFAEKFGLETFCKVATVQVGVAEKEVGKEALAEVVEKSVTVTGVSVEYERQEVTA